MNYKTIFQGSFYSVVEDDTAVIVLLEGKPISGACKYHGNHELFDFSCPYLENLVKKVTLKL
ncbi:MAG: hypothetical protein QXV69_03565 [Sulfolobaceae archaeon]